MVETDSQICPRRPPGAGCQAPSSPDWLAPPSPSCLPGAHPRWLQYEVGQKAGSQSPPPRCANVTGQVLARLTQEQGSPMMSLPGTGMTISVPSHHERLSPLTEPGGLGKPWSPGSEGLGLTLLLWSSSCGYRWGSPLPQPLRRSSFRWEGTT